MQGSAQKRQHRRIGKYELISKIAQGGMGTLYKARHPTLDRVVLLKKLTLQGGAQSVERFRREASLMMDFKNERIVQVHDHFQEGGSWFIVEEYVDGISLDALLRRERYLSFDAAALILREICAALQYAHDKKVIHRDIKPGNVILSRDGQVKLVDFGIATALGERSDGLTREGTILGTPAYIAPEQIDDASSVDRRADIYSLGVVLYEMITGRTPFPGTFTAETFQLIHKGRYVAARRLNPTASRLLARISRTCMRVKPRRRYRDVGRIMRLLDRRMRRSDPASIGIAVRRLLEGKDNAELFRRPRSWLWRLLILASAVVALGAAAWAVSERGLWYETVAADRFGALVVSMEGPPEGDTGPAPPPVLYGERGGVFERLGGLDFRFHENTSLRGRERVVMESRTLYLPAGRYRMAWSRDGELSWLAFTLQPRVEQRGLLATLNGQRITVRETAGPMSFIALRVVVRSGTSGQDITSSSEVLLLLDGKWQPWTPREPQGYVAGRPTRIRIESPGYAAEELPLDLSGARSVVSVEASLVPRQEGP